MRAIILSAGQGSRLLPLTADRPKCLIDFSGKTLLDCIRLGDLPGVGMTVIDGVVRTQRSRNTPPAERAPVVVAK